MKNSAKFVFLGIVFYGILSTASSADCLISCDFSKRAPIVVNTSYALADYPLHIRLNYSSGMKADFSDVRFASLDGAKKLPYYIENKQNGSWSDIWVKADSLSAGGGEQLWMVYGNPGAASESNGSAVFSFFEDFQDGILATKWTKIESIGTITEHNGYLETPECGEYGYAYCQDGLAYVYLNVASASGLNTANPYRIGLKTWNQEDDVEGETSLTSLWRSVPATGTINGAFFHHGDPNNRIGTYSGGYANGTLTGYGPMEDRWISEEFYYNGTKIILSFDGTARNSYTWSASQAYLALGMTRGSDWSIDDNRWDDLFIAKAAEREPTVTVGSAEDNTAAAADPSSRVSVTRSIPSVAYQGSVIPVMLTLDVNESNMEKAIGVTEYYPSGWTASNISLGGFDRGDRIEWLFWVGGNPVMDRNITYGLLVPSNAPLGTYSFNGTAGLGDGAYVNTSGAGRITISEGCALVGDYPPCGAVTINEVVSLIVNWCDGEANLSDVVKLILKWSS